MKRQYLIVSIAIIIALLAGLFYWSFFRTAEGASTQISEAVVAIEEPDDASSWTVFEIDSTQSQASFDIAEILRGDDFTVVGTTDQVGGQVGVDLADPTTAKIGEIVINARTFVTDSDMRNRAIQNRILFTDDYEFVRFQPTAINGLPESATVGDSVEVEIVGDLTIKDATQSETFAATITYVNESQITGSASTTIIYADYGVEVPLTPSVSFVADELTLTLDFVAIATG